MDILHCSLGYAMIFLCKKYNLQNGFAQYDERHCKESEKTVLQNRNYKKWGDHERSE